MSYKPSPKWKKCIGMLAIAVSVIIALIIPDPVVIAATITAGCVIIAAL